MDEWGSFYFSSGLDNRKRLERGLGGRWSLILFSHRVCRSWWIFGSFPFCLPFHYFHTSLPLIVFVSFGLLLLFWVARSLSGVVKQQDYPGCARYQFELCVSLPEIGYWKCRRLSGV